MSNTFAIPRPYARIVRWAEFVFVFPVAFLLSFLPFPPHRAEAASFAVLSIGMLAAGFVWWGLRRPTRAAWQTAFVLAPSPDLAVFWSYVFASVPAMIQVIVLLAWSRAAVLARATASST